MFDCQRTKYISGKAYNLLNLLKEITFENGNKISYYCDVAGAGGDDLKITHISKLTIVRRAEPVEAQADDYYPAVYPAASGSLSFNSFMDTTETKRNYLYQGKEYQSDLDLNIYDFEARIYGPVLGKTYQQDPHAENYFSLSVYSFSSNNPLLFIDPTGKDISSYIWEKDDDGNWKPKPTKVNFSQLDKNVQKSLEAFAKTDDGYAYLSQFAKAGDKVGSVEFKYDGQLSKHEMGFNQFDSKGSS